MSELLGDEQQSYQRAVKGLHDFGANVLVTLAAALSSTGIQHQPLTYRVKEQGSAHRKLRDKAGKYRRVDEFTDLLGLRIVTYLAEDVDKVFEAIKPEIQVDLDNTVDKRVYSDANRFGYSSLHVVATLSSDNLAKRQFLGFGEFKFEIQIRSTLQDAWAAIEHDLGYKSPDGIPAVFERRFSRLSALLEMADEEFARLKSEVDDYEENARSLVAGWRTGLKLDQATLQFAVGARGDMLELDQRVCRAMRCDLESKPSAEFIAARVADFRELGIHDLDSVISIVSAASDHIERFAVIWSGMPGRRPPRIVTRAPIGIHLYFIEFAVKAARGRKRLKRWSYFGEGYDPNQIDETWQKVVSEVGPVEI